MEISPITGKKRPSPSGRFFLRAASDRSGVSLIIVLWVMALLMVIVTEFAFTMRVETALVRNFKDETSAYHLAVAGINMGISEIAGRYNYVSVDKDGKLVFVKREEGSLKQNEAQREFDLGDGKVSYTISDEKGKLNLNTATREMLATLLKLTGVEEAERDVIADSALDWRDPNPEFHRLNGAKDDYYMELPKPYAAKNGFFDTVEELLLVKGVTPAIFYGRRKVPPEFGSDEGRRSLLDSEYKGVSEYLTVKGDGRININTAAEPVLEAVFGKGRAHEIILRRSTEGLYEIPAYGGALSSNVFSIYSKGEVRGIKVGVKAIAELRPGVPGVTISYWKNDGVSPD